jgi:hypothetical protein
MKRLFVLSAIASLLVAMLASSWAGSNLNSSRSNIYRDACKGKPDGTVVKVEGKSEKCPAPPETKPEPPKTRSNSY